MIIDRTHLKWGLATGGAAILAVLAYGATYHVPQREAHLLGSVGHTPLGMAYGILALVIFIFAALLGWRRKHPSWRLGRMQVWMKGHIWLTFLTVPLVFMHAGFRSGGWMTTLLLWCYVAVMVSGVYGLALQHILPKIMRDRLPDEVIFEQIPHLLGRLVERAQAIRGELVKSETSGSLPDCGAEAAAETGPAADPAGSTPTPEIPGAFVDLMDQHVIPYLQLPRGDRTPLDDPRTAGDLIMAAKLHSAASWHPAIEEVSGLVARRRQLDLQTRLQHWLSGWILLHAPLSFILLILTVWHAAVSLWAY